jgi:ribonuclease R
MLLANRTVAETIGKPKGQDKPKTFVYRIHDTPDPDKLADFVNFIKRFGYQFKAQTTGDIAHSMNALMLELKGKGEENMIENLAIRTMAKAVYSTDNIGHYGLAFPFYSHFTSPIRRYPDVMLHRLLERYLAGGKSADANHYEHLCEHSSNMEKKASDAERDSTKYYQVLYMQKSIGQEFKGVVSGVTEWGIYVELEENKCEGMIKLRDFNDDFYQFDQKNYRVIGNNSGRVINLGDELTIRVKHADLVRRQLDFELVEEEED